VAKYWNTLASFFSLRFAALDDALGGAAGGCAGWEEDVMLLADRANRKDPEEEVQDKRPADQGLGRGLQRSIGTRPLFI
jgi:hypothetical protein